MYKTIIKFKPTVSEEEIVKLTDIANKQFNNRVGKVENTSNEKYTLIFQGEEVLYGCLNLGMFSLKKVPGYLQNVLSWNWIDEDPNENCDMLNVYQKGIV